jgi:hypothetical protein
MSWDIIEALEDTFMSIQQISPGSVAANPAYVNPQAKTDQTTAPPQVSQDAHKATQAIKTDTVTISKQALRQVSNDGNSAAKKAKENTAEKASATFRGIA